MKPIFNFIQKFKFFRYLPVILFFIGYFIYFMKGSTPLFWIFLVLFVFFAATLIYMDWKNPLKKTQKTLSSKITLLLTLVILVLVYLFALKYPIAFDLTENKMYSLSAKSKEITKSLPAGVKIMVFQDDRTPDLKMGPWGAKIYDHIKNLLEEYKRNNPGLEVSFINPDEDTLSRTRYQPRNVGDIIILSDAGQRYLAKDELVKWKVQKNPYGQMERVVEGFLAEEKITASLISLLEKAKPVILWLEGDGEVDFDGQESASILKAELENNNFEIKKISSVKKNELAGDIILIAGPTKTIPKETALEIENFMKQGKTLILLKDPSLDNIPSGLEAFLKNDFNIELVNQIVLDDQQAFRNPINLIPSYEYHVITEILRKNNLPLVFPLSSSLKLGGEATKILTASSSAWAESNFAQIKKSGGVNVKNKKKTDSTLVIAALSENAQTKSKVLVIANSSFIKNTLIGIGGNKDFIVNSLNYLMNKKAPLSIAKPIEKERFITLSEAQRQFFFFIFVILLPALIVGTGIWIGLKRRRFKNPEA